MEKEKQEFEAWWTKPIWDDAEYDFSSRWDEEKEISAGAFYGGYHSRDEEIAALYEKIERKDSALREAQEIIRRQLGVDSFAIEQALEGGSK